MEQGYIARMKADKGFGFIKAGDDELFFHMSQCKTPFKELREGHTVAFETVQHEKGLRAINVTAITATRH